MNLFKEINRLDNPQEKIKPLIKSPSINRKAKREAVRTLRKEGGTYVLFNEPISVWRVFDGEFSLYMTCDVVTNLMDKSGLTEDDMKRRLIELIGNNLTSGFFLYDHTENKGTYMRNIYPSTLFEFLVRLGSIEIISDETN